MKINFLKKQGHRLPEVGEVWMHAKSDIAWLRIDDNQGARALNMFDNGQQFFSVSLAYGNISVTQKAGDDIIVLEAELNVKPQT